MILVNAIGEKTKYTNEDIKGLFKLEDKNEMNVSLIEPKKIHIITGVGNKFPLMWFILNPTKEVTEYFKQFN